MIKYYHDEGNSNKVSWSLIQHALVAHNLWRGKCSMCFVKVRVILFVHSFTLSQAKMVIYIDLDCSYLNNGCVLRCLCSSILL